ncbi:helix-turn-helix transcriptional regulator [Candidatus Woesearchaeota archaeon]|nr:helix-turn-helix transcriptional regulator [Candidatus Woesearchaeota archaeon]
MERESFAEALRRIFNEDQVDISRFAKEYGVTRSMIFYALQGRSVIYRTLINLAQILDRIPLLLFDSAENILLPEHVSPSLSPQDYLRTVLRTQRLELGLTQRAMADRLSIDHSLIAYYERGQGMPRTDTLEKLCDVLLIIPSYLRKKEELR